MFRANQPIFALDASTGEIIWTATLPTGRVTEVLLDEGRATLYALTSGQAVALNAQTGAIKFAAKPLLGSQCFSGEGSIASDGTLYVGCDNDMSSHLSAYSPTGEAKWLRNLGPYSGTYGPLIDASGVIYAANPGSITALTPNNEVIWRMDSLYRSDVRPVIDAQKNVYIIAAQKNFADRDLLVVNAGKVVENKGPVDAGYYGALLLGCGWTGLLQLKRRTDLVRDRRSGSCCAMGTDGARSKQNITKVSELVCGTTRCKDGGYLSASRLVV